MATENVKKEMDPVLKNAFDNLTELYNSLIEQYGGAIPEGESPMDNLCKTFADWCKTSSRSGYLKATTTLEYTDNTEFSYEYERTEKINHPSGEPVITKELKQLSYKHDGTYETKVEDNLFNPLANDYAKAWFIYPDKSYNELSINPSYHKACIDDLEKAFKAVGQAMPEIGIYASATVRIPILDESMLTPDFIKEYPQYTVKSKKKIKGNASYKNDSDSSVIEAKPVIIKDGTWGNHAVEHTFFIVYDFRKFVECIDAFKDVLLPVMTSEGINDALSNYTEQQVRRIKINYNESEKEIQEQLYKQFKLLPKDAQIGYMLKSNTINTLITVLQSISISEIFKKRMLLVYFPEPMVIIKTRMAISPFCSTQVALTPKRKSQDISLLQIDSDNILNNQIGVKDGYFNAKSFNLVKPTRYCAFTENYTCGEISLFGLSLKFTLKLPGETVVDYKEEKTLDKPAQPFNDEGSTILETGKEAFKLVRKITKMSLEQRAEFKPLNPYELPEHDS